MNHLLHGLAATVGSQRAFHVVSGYRFPATNQTLRQSSSGVAGGSLHLRGRPIDIRLASARASRVSWPRGPPCRSF